MKTYVDGYLKNATKANQLQNDNQNLEEVIFLIYRYQTNVKIKSEIKHEEINNDKKSHNSTSNSNSKVAARNSEFLYYFLVLFGFRAL